MGDFLDEAYRLRRYTSVELNRQAFDLVFNAIAQLNSVYAKSYLELRNIESVFASLEMATLFGRLGDLLPADLERLVPSIKRLILETIEITQRFRQVSERIRATESFEKFVDLILALTRNNHDVSVLTFNYDVGIDFALQYKSVLVNNAIDDASAPEGSPSFLKLHGSLNWAQCPKCQNVTVKALSTAKFEGIDSQGDFVRLRHGKAIDWAVHCTGAGPEEPFIVPPTWNKSPHYEAIRKVWQTAATKLSSAENIVIIGYSLPETDQFFRYLYALGSVGSSRIQRFWVFNPDVTLNERYQRLLGPLARERYVLNPVDTRNLPGTFEAAIRQTSSTLLPP